MRTTSGMSVDVVVECAEEKVVAVVIPMVVLLHSKGEPRARYSRLELSHVSLKRRDVTALDTPLRSKLEDLPCRGTM